MLFSEKLKDIRKQNNMTQEKLAEKLNVSRQAITKWECDEGIPDIENLKQISNLFNVTIDELVKEDKEVNVDIIKQYHYKEELVIDHTKHFDIHLCKINDLKLKPSNDDTVIVDVSSNEEENLSELYKVIFDNKYDNLDIDIKNKKPNSDLSIVISLPEKYIEEIELNIKSKYLFINDLTIERLEYDGELKYLNVNNSKGRIELNTTRSDVEVRYNKFDGALEVNTINSVARVEIPKGTKYQTILEGRLNSFIDATNTENASNIIELNGLNSKLIIIEK